jgi:hypothetical protein
MHVKRIVVVSVFALGTALVLIFGTVMALPKYNHPATYRLAVVTEPSHNYVVRVIGSEAADFAVAQDGRVTIDVPRLPRSCSWVCLGITIRDGSPYNSKAIQVLRDGKIVRRLSLRQLERLHMDEAGVRKMAL